MEITWHVWLAVGIILFILEILTPGGFILACLGTGCLVSALASFIGLNFGLQVGSFIVASLALFAGIRPLFIKYFSVAKNGKTNIEALIGQVGIVSQDIDPATDQGRIIVGGQDWKAISADNKFIKSGEKVTVVNVDGVKLLVKSLTTLEGE